MSSGIIVAAAVIERAGKLLVTRRGRGAHLEGYWEFPGGKCEPDESDRACLERELREELAVDSRVQHLILSTTHAYPDRVVELHFYRCDLLGEPRPVLGQEMRWVTREELPTLMLPPADRELVCQLMTEK